MTKRILISVAIWIFFAAGYLETYQFISANGGSYFFLLSLVALLSCLLLLRRLNGQILDTFPIYIMLIVFGVGYFLQFFILASDPIAPTGQIIITRNVTSFTYAEIYATTVLAFSAFCLTSYILLGRHQGSETKPEVISLRTEDVASLVRLLFSLILPLEIILGYFTWTEQIAVMGAQNASLPFRLAGIIFYSRTTILPALILLLISTADQYHLRRSFSAGILLFLLHGLADTLLRSSRSALVFTLLAIFFLLAVSRRFTRRRFRLACAGVLLSLLLFPIITAYRYARTESGFSAFGSALKDGVVTVENNGTVSEILSDTGYSLVFRLTGADSLLEIINRHPRQIGLLHMNQVTDFFNDYVMNIDGDSVTTYAPSLVGWFYLVGGNAFVLAGIIAFVTGVQLLWNKLRSIRLQCRWVAQALFLVLFVYAASDGVLDHLVWSILMNGVSVALAEYLVRRYARRSNLPNRVRPREAMAC